MEAKSWVEIIAAATIPISIIAITLLRAKTSENGPKGIGVRAIQFVGISIIPPLILILALEGILEKSAVGALVGALAGYLFANIGEFDKKRGRNTAPDFNAD
jgi:hypothetical protein